ncbi:hypothetical protein C0J52_26949 [Blattella germanica]|nr:hypothetical protein C0J52_26949 [Blattella germanica]
MCDNMDVLIQNNIINSTYRAALPSKQLMPDVVYLKTKQLFNILDTFKDGVVNDSSTIPREERSNNTKYPGNVVSNSIDIHDVSYSNAIDNSNIFSKQENKGNVIKSNNVDENCIDGGESFSNVFDDIDNESYNVVDDSSTIPEKDIVPVYKVPVNIIAPNDDGGNVNGVGTDIIPSSQNKSRAMCSIIKQNNMDRPTNPTNLSSEEFISSFLAKNYKVQEKQKKNKQMLLKALKILTGILDWTNDMMLKFLFASDSTKFLTQVSLCDTVDPLDYEDFIQQHQLLLDRDPLHHVLDFPASDIKVIDGFMEELSPHVRDCVQLYTADWVVVNYQYRHLSSSSWVRDRGGERHSLVQVIPRQSEPGLPSCRQSIHSVDTPRGSWASFDLRNSVSDPPIPSLLERVPPETIDQLNEVRRQEDRQIYTANRKSSSSSFDQFRKRASDMGSLTRRGSLERRSNSEKRRSWSPEDFGSSLDTFRPVTLTVSSFFKQVH